MNRSADFWQIHGAAHGPWLTLCHPIGSDRHIWDALIPTLAPHYRLLSYDLLHLFNLFLQFTLLRLSMLKFILQALDDLLPLSN